MKKHLVEYEGMTFAESISAEEIQKEVVRVAEEINADYAGMTWGDVFDLYGGKLRLPVWTDLY